MDSLAKLLECGLAAAAMDIIVTRGAIFGNLRAWTRKRSKFFGDLAYCPLCFGTWASIFVTVVTDLRLFGHRYVAVDWFLSALAVAAIAVVGAWAMYETMHRIYVPDDYEQED